MAAPHPDVERLRAARARGPIATLGAYLRLSGPGFLQSALTLGGGSLASSLYSGVLGGMSLLWLQPLAMLLGIAMLSAIGWVTLTLADDGDAGTRPFRALARHVSPVLAWGWALASLAANMVWSLPQFALATGTVRQNLLPQWFGDGAALGGGVGRVLIVAALAAAAVAVTFGYGDRRGRGVRLYETILKAMVALIVACFVGVVWRLATAADLDFGAVARGFVPDPRCWTQPAAAFGDLLAGMAADARAFWTARIVGEQRDVVLSAAATAVGINMTFLLPYSLLRRGWGREFRGLLRFDLLLGMLLPFTLATSCVVIASASRFHAVPVAGLVSDGAAPPAAAAAFDGMLAERAAALGGAADAGERTLAAMLVKRDAFDLADALTPLLGEGMAQVLFGLGVLAMALSTISLLMLVSGFVVCELSGAPLGGRTFRLATLLALTGTLGPFMWSKAAFWLAVPTSVFGMTLLPIAYWAFVAMLNSRRLLGEARPRGGARLAWNALMLPAAGLATAASVYGVWSKAGALGIAAVAAFAVAVVVVRPRR